MTPNDTTNAVEQTETASILSKLSANAVGCNKGIAAAEPQGSTREIYLFRVFGFVLGLERGETENAGEYFALQGRFQARNMQLSTDQWKNENYGKLYESDTLFLPPGGHDTIVAQVQQMGLTWDEPNNRKKTVTGRIKDGGQLSIACDVYVKKDTNASGITYVTKPILTTPNDPMAEIRRAIAEAEDKVRAAAQVAGGSTGKPKQLTEAKK